MAADETACPVCGRPLLGRDRFEGKCSACREKEVLAEVPLDADRQTVRHVTHTCPHCGASHFQGESTCPECGRRLARRRRTWVWAAAIVLVLGAAAAGGYHLLRPETPSEQRPAAGPRPRRQMPPAAGAKATEPTPVTHPAPVPPSPAAVAALTVETRELIALLAADDYGRVIDNYCQPDKEAFARIQRASNALIMGEAAQGFRRWSTLLVRRGREHTIEALRKAGDPHPDYTALLLAHLVRSPAASGSHRSSEDRARDLVQWHLEGLFGGLELAEAQVREVRPAGHQRFVAALDCPGQAAQPRPGDDPRAILWADLPVGWVFRTKLPERVETVVGILGRPAEPTEAQR